MKYWVLCRDDEDPAYMWNWSWQTNFFLVALIYGYCHYNKFDEIEIRCEKKWHWIIKR